MPKTDSNVSRVYAALRRMAADFDLKPDERINESALSLRLGASRTPLREALNRLVAEGFLTFHSGRGFFCRSLSPSLAMELYEARVAVEAETARLAARNASDSGLVTLMAQLENGAAEYAASTDAARLLEMDEAFHLEIAALSGNNELRRMVENLNDRVRFIRLMFMKRMIAGGAPQLARLAAHRAIAAAIASRDEGSAAEAMRGHIERRREEAAEAVRIAYSQLYVPDEKNA